MIFKKVLVANRGEIAIRIFRACAEIGIKTVGIYTYEDRYSPHRFKADESYQIGVDDQPLRPYLNMDEIIEMALRTEVDAIHPGYGFLSENSEFAEKCKANNIVFIGPRPNILKELGDKVRAKKIAVASGVPIVESSTIELTEPEIAISEGNRIGYPVILKAASGGGGRGMRIVKGPIGLEKSFMEAHNEALNAFGDGTVFMEKYIEDPKHIEIQVVGDNYGNIVHLFERDCSVQRRYQKVVEFAPSFGIEKETLEKMYSFAISICKKVKYNSVGTVEFLIDKIGNVYFMEVNPRIQVEHTVTELVTKVDLIKTQIFIASGYRLSDERINIQRQQQIVPIGYAVQCRITSEDPENDFLPDHGVVTKYRSASGYGIRLDEGNIYDGIKISPFFDSLLVKACSYDRTLHESCGKMERVLNEFQISGIKTNILFLKNIVKSPVFRNGQASVNFIKNRPELAKITGDDYNVDKLLKFLGSVVVNGNPNVNKVDPGKSFLSPNIPSFEKKAPYPKGTKDLLNEMGPERFSEWLKNETKIHYTDTTMRDAHQSLLATRMRTTDMLNVAEGFAKNHPEIFSVEMWGGATFDVCLRFLKENPWERLSLLRQAIPNILTQMLIRGTNAVGYTAYPDNLIEKFVEEAWEAGVDIFRIFDSLNGINPIASCIEYVRKRTGGLAEGTLCYTGDILNPEREKYDLNYYLQLGRDIENAGAHVLGIKDMAGLLKPQAAYELITALKNEVNIPIHLHTHDTSSIQAATYLRAIDAGVDVIDVALGGLSGLTSQPNLNSIVEMLRFHERENNLDTEKLNEYSNYWEAVRSYYYPFESGLKSGTGEVYQHEIPGGQYSNLKSQAVALGLENKFSEVTKMYAEVNQLFGDIVKVTPSSKVVGDMAQYLIGNGLTIPDVMENGEKFSFPDSVKNFFKGNLGYPQGGFPEKIREIVLKGEKIYMDSSLSTMTNIDFDCEFEAFRKKFSLGWISEPQIYDFLSFKLYPKVFEEFYQHQLLYGNLIHLPTKNFFYGMAIGEEIEVELSTGNNVLIELVTVGCPDDKGFVRLLFKVNGEYQYTKTKNLSLRLEKNENIKANQSNPKEIGSPLQGLLSKVMVEIGQKVKENDPLFILEAMKMESTVVADCEGVIRTVVLNSGSLVNTNDLILTME